MTERLDEDLIQGQGASLWYIEKLRARVDRVDHTLERLETRAQAMYNTLYGREGEAGGVMERLRGLEGWQKDKRATLDKVNRLWWGTLTAIVITLLTASGGVVWTRINRPASQAQIDTVEGDIYWLRQDYKRLQQENQQMRETMTRQGGRREEPPRPVWETPTP